MTRSLSRTLRGRAALDAFVAYLAPASGDWGPPDRLQGGNRNAYANHQAVRAFLTEIAERQVRYVYLEQGKRTRLGQARFRRDQDGDEGLIGFENNQTSLDGIRARICPPGVLNIVDRWGDTVSISIFADICPDENAWNTDEWDLPAAVPSLAIDDARVADFEQQIAALGREMMAIGPTERANAESAIHDHFRQTTGMYEDGEAGPVVHWYASPAAALAALKISGRDRLGLVKSLRNSALSFFDMEVEVRLAERADTLRHALETLVQQEIGVDLDVQITNALFRQAGHRAFARLGLARDIKLLAWYDFLKFNGMVLPDSVESFCFLTRSVWLLFPSDIIFVVDRPTALEKDEMSLTLVFSDGNRLILPRENKA